MNELLLIFIQTQTRINTSDEDSDDDENLITESSKGPQFDEIAKKLHNVFDNTDDYLFAELNAIINHIYSADVLEFKVKYINWDMTWHPIDLVKDEDPHATANYIITNV